MIDNEKIKCFKFALAVFGHHFTAVDIPNQKLYSLKKYFDNSLNYDELKLLLDMCEKVTRCDSKYAIDVIKIYVPYMFVNSSLRYYMRKMLDKEHGYNELDIYGEGIELSTPFYHKQFLLHNFKLNAEFDGNIVHLSVRAETDNSYRLYGAGATIDEGNAHLIQNLHDTIRNLVHVAAFTEKLRIFTLQPDIYKED
jgi:hypothetical protein